MTHSYEFWQNALQGNFGQLSEGDSHPGFWRRRTSRAGKFTGVAIWPDEAGNLVCVSDKRQADPAETFSYCVKHPVSEAAYRTWEETGMWPDEDSAMVDSLSPPPSGHNAPADEAEMLQDQINSAVAGVDAYTEIKDDEAASRAQGLRSRLLELSGTAEKSHKVEKAPSLEEGRRIDKRWFPLRDLAKTGADKIRAALSAHETRKDQIRRAEEAARQKAAQEAERERLVAIEAGKPAPAPAPEPPPQPIPVPATSIKSGYGRAASVKSVKVATVTDQDAAYQGMKTHPELVALIAALAQRAVNAGHTVPGVSVEEKKDVR